MDPKEAKKRVHKIVLTGGEFVLQAHGFQGLCFFSDSISNPKLSHLTYCEISTYFSIIIVTYFIPDFRYFCQ